ncbi:Golgin candidate [Striga asiatica]|uniref:Golgin candidate n=1 Tax=Striga asiatica TaxID=4170 RepID=A0A5A7PIH9_STRAF|nr:Golgin candidate [Striga asiatica]
MAHWISSKLRAAETLLQQIDQQAAESLKKNDKLPAGDQLHGESSPRTPNTKPLIKDQLKKKHTENVVNQSSLNIGKPSSNVISRNNSVIYRDDDTPLSTNQNLKSNMSGGPSDGDWTELLSLPDKKGVSGGGSLSRSINRVSGIRTLKQDKKNLGSSSPGKNISVVDGKGKKLWTNGVSKNSKKTNVELENSTSSDFDEKASNVGDVTPRTSSSQSPSSSGESGYMNSGSTLAVGNPKIENMGQVEVLNDSVDGDKVQNNSDNSWKIMPISRENELDTKVGLDNGERFKRDSSASNRSLGSVKKASSSPSDGESSNTETDTSSSSDSESEREREERRKRRQQMLAERAAAKAAQAIIERENLVARLEGEKQSLEKILEERAKQQVMEASELQSTMMETMEAVELEKQKHKNTRMEALARLAELESANADLTRSLANVQKNLEMEVDCIAELRQQIHVKETIHEELRRKISSMHENDGKPRVTKGLEFELGMLKAEYSFINDKVGRMQEKAKTLETSIETTQREIENPTEVETELKRRLRQLTDHLIQKQAQVETLSSEKAMLLLRIEAVSRMLDEHKLGIDSTEFPSASSRDERESGSWRILNSNLSSLFSGKMQSGQRHLGSLVRQLDSLFCMGAMFLRRNSTARKWSFVYLACLHLWVMYILMSHSQVSDDGRSGAVFSLENINNTGSV